jgi:hypothetical protein
MSEPPETHVPIADGWALLIAQVVVLWGAVDNSMENVTEALRTFPECLGVPPSTHHSFAKRAAHWHALHLVYFASLPRMKKFGSQTHKRLMDVSSERDLFVRPDRPALDAVVSAEEDTRQIRLQALLAR